MRTPLDYLQIQLGYRFNNLDLLDAALTHRSFPGAVHNERLEFLGDALLGFVMAEYLHAQFPAADEGHLSRLRSSLVKRETLAQLGEQLKIGQYLNMGAGELRTGGQSRDSTMADAMEALFAALYLDAGLEVVRGLILRLYQDLLTNIPLTPVKDPKTRLQEYLQSFRRPLPTYEVIRTQGLLHQQEFTVLCQLEDSSLSAQGHGSSRRRAEQDAAQQLLERLNHE